MRQYYEAREILPESSEIDPDFNRIDITDMLDPEQAEVLQLIKDQFVGMNYNLSIHNCYHDESKQCNIEVIV